MLIWVGPVPSCSLNEEEVPAEPTVSSSEPECITAVVVLLLIVALETVMKLAAPPSKSELAYDILLPTGNGPDWNVPPLAAAGGAVATRPPAVRQLTASAA